MSPILKQTRFQLQVCLSVCDLFVTTRHESVNGENTQIVNEMFRIRDEACHELRQRSFFHILLVNTVFIGTESIDFSEIWGIQPSDIKCLENLPLGLQFY